MATKKKKITIAIIIVIFVILVISGVCIALYINTDMFKSNKTLCLYSIDTAERSSLFVKSFMGCT